MVVSSWYFHHLVSPLQLCLCRCWPFLKFNKMEVSISLYICAWLCNLYWKNCSNLLEYVCQTDHNNFSIIGFFPLSSFQIYRNYYAETPKTHTFLASTAGEGMRVAEDTAPCIRQYSDWFCIIYILPRNFPGTSHALPCYRGQECGVGGASAQ